MTFETHGPSGSTTPDSSQGDRRDRNWKTSTPRRNRQAAGHAQEFRSSPKCAFDHPGKYVCVPASVEDSRTRKCEDIVLESRERTSCWMLPQGSRSCEAIPGAKPWCIECETLNATFAHSLNLYEAWYEFAGASRETVAADAMKDILALGII